MQHLAVVLFSVRTQTGKWFGRQQFVQRSLLHLACLVAVLLTAAFNGLELTAERNGESIKSHYDHPLPPTSSHQDRQVQFWNTTTDTEKEEQKWKSKKGAIMTSHIYQLTPLVTEIDEYPVLLFLKQRNKNEGILPQLHWSQKQEFFWSFGLLVFLFLSVCLFVRVAKCHRYGRYICVNILEVWGKILECNIRASDVG